MSRPIAVAKVTFVTGLILLAIAISAVALQGLSDWWWFLAPLVITTNGVIWMRRVNKYGTIVPIPKHSAPHTR
jgi:hypothetical protein